MIVVKNKWMSAKGMCLWPFVCIRPDVYHTPEARFIKNHEKIHWMQALEMLVIPFYITYGVAFVVRYWKNKKAGLRYPSLWAYKRLKFEQEAFKFQHDLDYLSKRKPYAMWRAAFGQ